MAASPTRTAPLDIAPSATTQGSTSEEETPEPAEAMVAMVKESALDDEHAPGAAVGVNVAGAEAEPGRLPEEAEADPVAETDTDAVIEVPYSFMRDDDAAGGERTAPYSFMAADDLRAASRNGAKPDLDDEAAMATGDPVSNPRGGDPPREAKPLLRLVGRQRARMP